MNDLLDRLAVLNFCYRTVLIALCSVSTGDAAHRVAVPFASVGEQVRRARGGGLQWRAAALCAGPQRPVGRAPARPTARRL